MKEPVGRVLRHGWIAAAYPYACASAAVVSNAWAGRFRYAIAWSVAVIAFAMVMVVVVGLVRRARRGARAIAA